MNRPIMGALAAALVGAVVASGVTLGLAPRAQGGEAVRTYLLDHPEVIPEAMERLQQRQTAQSIAANRAAIVTPFPGAVAGNPQGDVTLTEYYDYACGYCRQSVGDIDRLIAADPKLRVVFKEMPVLSPLSDTAARMSLAAARAGRFAAFHHALYAAGPLDDASLARVAAQVGVTPAQAATPAIAREIDTTMATVRALRLTGTPTFVVGDQLLSGAMGYEALRAAVAETRKARAG
jgi:protein-disulfide isomerase